MIVLGVASRSSTIDAVLKPLVAEVRRRRSVYSRHSIYEPLADVCVDSGNQHPDKEVIGRERPSPSLAEISKPQRIRQVESSPSTSLTSRVAFTTSSADAPARRSAAKTISRHSRHSSFVIPTYRSVSSSDQGHTHVQLGSGWTSPRPRTSMDPPRLSDGAPSRKMARSAHLHTVEADHVRDRAHNGGRQEIKAKLGTGENELQKYLSELDNKHRFPGYPITESRHNDVLPTQGSDAHHNQLVMDSGDGERDEWGTDADTDASTSEVDTDLYAGFGKEDRHAVRKSTLDQDSANKR